MSNQREHRESASPAIAVVGVSALFPGSSDVRGFWRSIVEGQDQIKEIPPNYWLLEDYYDPDPAAPDKTYGKTGAFLDAVPFDALGYGVPPNVVQQTDTSQLLGLIVAQQVLEDAAGGDFQHIDKSRISVILGATGATELVVHLGARLQRPIWLNALRANGIPEDEAQVICGRIADSYVPWTEASFPGLLGNVVAGRIANKFDLGGTNCVVDAACASSLSALAMGLSELYLGQSDMVIVGGVDTLNDILMYMCFSKTPALSATGDCRPFSDQADGTILGEGLGMLALRRLEDAERDGDRIYAVIRGIGSSSDGKGTAVYAPKASGQAHALRRAYASAGYSPRTVELLEAHGTATKAGDVAEFAGAASVFAEADAESKQWCAIGSVKSQIGHTKGAAGAASLIKAVLALHHKVLPPTIKADRPNPNLAIEESPFYINSQSRPWIRDDSHPRRAGVSSFGFGGSNFHVTLEEYTGSERKDEFRPSPTELFLLSANDVAALTAGARELTAGYDSADGFQFLAHSSQVTFRTTDRVRLAVVARDLADLCAKLETAVAAIDSNPAGAQQSPAGWYYSGEGAPAHQGKLAFIFPGQGSQYVNMSGDVAMAFNESRAMWDEAAGLEFEQVGRLQDVVFPPPVFSDEDRVAQEARLRATEWAQPAIGVASLSLLALLAKLGIKPDVVGGHSFGEVTALHTAGVLDRKAFFAVARKRGELMAEAAAMFPGAMTAISHATDAVATMLANWNTGVVIANHNSPDQVVISGIESAIQATEEKLRAAAIRFQRLPVSTAFHSSVVRPAAAPFRAFLEHIAFQKPLLPVYANSTASLYSNVPDAIRETLADQIAEPVRFAEQIEAMYAAGVRTFVEVGPRRRPDQSRQKLLEGAPAPRDCTGSQRTAWIDQLVAGVGAARRRWGDDGDGSAVGWRRLRRRPAAAQDAQTRRYYQRRQLCQTLSACQWRGWSRGAEPVEQRAWQPPHVDGESFCRARTRKRRQWPQRHSDCQPTGAGAAAHHPTGVAAVRSAADRTASAQASHCPTADPIPANAGAACCCAGHHARCVPGLGECAAESSAADSQRAHGISPGCRAVAAQPGGNAFRDEGRGARGGSCRKQWRTCCL
jgi:polyketide-type polyunsaturated fatty acid synthase PfaA